jgi:hypothetical protein
MFNGKQTVPGSRLIFILFPVDKTDELDIPLGTLSLLQQKQKEIVSIHGSKQMSVSFLFVIHSKEQTVIIIKEVIVFIN